MYLSLFHVSVILDTIMGAEAPIIYLVTITVSLISEIYWNVRLDTAISPT